MAQAETATRVEVGAIIASTYEIKRLLGRGGMGTVWEAHHARLPGKRVAIKVLHPEVAKDSESLARFRREAEIASRIGHPNIVDVHDFNELADGTPYLILEYLEGSDLEDRLKHGAMPLDQVIAIARQIGSALRAAHAEGVIHRDLKPQNVFLARTTDGAGNESEMAKVLDFGISKIRGSQTVQTQDSAILGTPKYMAPEQATGNHASVDARTDVFSLGTMLYEMISGKPAFTGQTIPEVVFKVVYEPVTPLDQLVSVPPNVAMAVHTALNKPQDERWESIEAFIEALSGTGLSVRGAPPVAQHTDEALASTIASGAFTPPPDLRPEPPGSDIGTANTIDSGRMSPDAVGLATDQTQLADSGQVPGPPTASVHTLAATPERKSRAGLWVVLVVVLLGAAGAAIAVAVTQDGSGAVAANDTADAGAANDAAASLQVVDAGAAADKPAVADAAPIAADAAEAAAGAGTGRDSGAGTSGTRAGGTGPGTAGKRDDPPDPPSSAADAALRKAEALIASNPQQAIRDIRKAQREGASGPASFAALAIAHCKLLDLTKVRASLTRVRSRGLRKRVIRKCRSFGMELE